MELSNILKMQIKIPKKVIQKASKLPVKKILKIHQNISISRMNFLKIRKNFILYIRENK